MEETIIATIAAVSVPFTAEPTITDLLPILAEYKSRPYGSYNSCIQCGRDFEIGTRCLLVSLNAQCNLPGETVRPYDEVHALVMLCRSGDCHEFIIDTLAAGVNISTQTYIVSK